MAPPVHAAAAAQAVLLAKLGHLLDAATRSAEGRLPSPIIRFVALVLVRSHCFSRHQHQHHHPPLSFPILPTPRRLLSLQMRMLMMRMTLGHPLPLLHDQFYCCHLKHLG